MKQNTSPSNPGVPDAFVTTFGRYVAGFRSGFDRLRFHGTLRMLFQPQIMEIYLLRRGVLLKDFKAFALALTERIKLPAKETAAKAGRPVRSLPSWTQSKEDLAREIARKDEIKTGLIAVFSAVEGCTLYTVRGNRETRKLELVLQPSRCTHLYHYFLHEEFGLCHVGVCKPGFPSASISV